MYIFLVLQKIFGNTIKIGDFILLLDFKTLSNFFWKECLFKNNLKSEPIFFSQKEINFSFNFFFKKYLTILTEFPVPPPNPPYIGIFFFTIILYWFLKYLTF